MGKLNFKTVYSTDSNKHCKPGTPLKYTEAMAEHVVNKGLASYDAPAGKKAKKEKEETV